MVMIQNLQMYVQNINPGEKYTSIYVAHMEKNTHTHTHTHTHILLPKESYQCTNHNFNNRRQ